MFYLNQRDVDVLKNTVNTVNNLSPQSQGNKRPVVKNAFAYAQLTTEDVNGLWSAVEVYFDETGTSAVLEGGRTWGGDEPSIIVNGDVSAEQVIRIEAYYLIDSNDEEQAVWIGSAIGGGASFYRLIVTEDFTMLNDSFSNKVSLIDDQGAVLETPVSVRQKKYTTADFYEGEILYAVDYSGGGYLLDPFLAGIGGTSA